MSDFPSPRLTTGQAARLLGVHASTVKRWFDDVPEDEMTPGSHRRLALDQVISEGRLRGYGTYLDAFGPDAGLVWQASAAWDQGNYASLHRLCYQWAKAGRADKIGKVLLHVGGGGRLDAEVLDGAFGGCLHMVGEAWEEGRFSVGEERAVSWEVVETLLQLIRENPPAGPEASTPVAVVGAMEGDHHFLGSLLVRALLTVKDWRVEFLGGDVPVEEFVATRNDHSAELICVSFTPPMGPPDVRRCVELISGLADPDDRFALAVGGSGSRGVELPCRQTALGSLFQADSLVALDRWLDGADLGEEKDRA